MSWASWECAWLARQSSCWGQSLRFVVFVTLVIIFVVLLLSFAVFAVFASFEALDLHELNILGVCLAGKTELLLGPVLAFCCFCHALHMERAAQFKGLHAQRTQYPWHGMHMLISFRAKCSSLYILIFNDMLHQWYRLEIIWNLMKPIKTGKNIKNSKTQQKHNKNGSWNTKNNRMHRPAASTGSSLQPVECTLRRLAPSKLLFR